MRWSQIARTMSCPCHDCSSERPKPNHKRKHYFGIFFVKRKETKIKTGPNHNQQQRTANWRIQSPTWNIWSKIRQRIIAANQSNSQFSEFPTSNWYIPATQKRIKINTNSDKLHWFIICFMIIYIYQCSSQQKSNTGINHKICQFFVVLVEVLKD